MQKIEEIIDGVEPANPDDMEIIDMVRDLARWEITTMWNKKKPNALTVKALAEGLEKWTNLPSPKMLQEADDKAAEEESIIIRENPHYNDTKND